MRTLRYPILLTLLGFFLSLQPLSASHLQGVDLTYECIGACTYRVHLRIYRDCSGITPAAPTVNWAIISGVGCPVPTPVSGWSSYSVQEVTPVCPGTPTRCNTPGATIIGVEEWHAYRDYNICGSNCIYRLSWSACARNPGITALVNPGGQCMYIGSTTLNTGLGSCNGSPQFNTPPVPYICMGLPFTFNQGAFDPDGDSLSYRLGPCYEAQGDGVNYNAGYNQNAPLGATWTVTMNPITGDITLVPMPGNIVVGVVCVYVDEWRFINGVWTKIGEVVRDVQINVIDCGTNNPPTTNGATNIVGGTGSGFDLDMCFGGSLCFDIPVTDPDPGQIATVWWNQNIAGGTFTQVGGVQVDTITGANPTIRFCFTPNQPGQVQFLTSMEDNWCPIIGSNQFSFLIDVHPLPTTQVMDSIACNQAFFTPINQTGTPPYTYSWVGQGGFNSNLTNPSHTYGSPGTYTYDVTITDANGCTQTFMDTVIIPQVMQLSGTHQDVLCNGDATGWIDIDVIGGVAPYNYLWNTVPPQVTDSIFGLPAGSYTVTVTDDIGCERDTTIIVTEPPVLTLSMASDDVQCNGVADGWGDVDASGGTPGYTYLWNTVPPQFTDSAIGLGPGTWQVIVTDAVGCMDTGTVTIDEPPLLTVSTSSVNANCGQPDGSATAVGAGGTPGYTYSWNTVPPQGTSTATGLVPGNYTVTVTDANNCTATANVIVGNNLPPVASISSFNDANCPNIDDGDATVSVAGGTPGYTYLWNTVPPQVGATATNLGAGTYTVVVTDDVGCQDSVSVLISSPPPFVISTNSYSVSCNGASDGVAVVYVSGATPGYTYSWNTVPPAITDSVSGLPAGTYTVTITDAVGCTEQRTVNVAQPLALGISIVSNDINCFGADNGNAAAIVAGGSGNYGYSWAPGGMTTPTITGLAPGTYTLTVTDTNYNVAGPPAICTASSSVTIIEPPVLTSSMAMTNANCGQPQGTATVTPGGGTPPYTYSWNTVPNQITQVAVALVPGLYIVTVTDDNNCVIVDSIVVGDNPPPTAAITDSVDILCFGQATGSATVAGAGGAGGYTYVWNSVPTQFTATAINLPAGTYTAIVTDQVGCKDSATVTLSEPPALVISTNRYPVTCNGASDGVAVAYVSGGTPGYTYSWNTNPVQVSDSISGLPGGNFSVTVTDANGCLIGASVLINEPTPLSLSLSKTNISCFGADDGTASSVIGGGHGNYSYLWTPGNFTTPGINNLPPGTYTLTVTDTAYGGVGGTTYCTISDSIVIIEPPVLSATLSSVNANCGQSDGFAMVDATGGTPFYSYLWNTVPPQFTDTASGVSPGTWVVTVTDGNGCTYTDSVVVGDNPPPTAAITDSTGTSCFGGSDGTATATGIGGAGGYTYLWQTVPPQVGATATGLAAGVYTVTVTDQVNCTATTSVTITEPTPISLTTNSYDATCYGGSDGIVVVYPSGGTPGFPPYTYLWWNINPPALTDSVTGLPAGTYSVWVTDGNNCTDSISVSVSEPPVFNLSGVTADVSCNGGNDGSVTLSVSGGHGNYSYSWAPGGQTTQNISGLTAGTYTVTVTDTNTTVGYLPAPLCTYSATFVITEPTALQITMSSVNANCQQPDGSATATVSGGTQPYAYQWSTIPVQTTVTATGLVPGTYGVLVTDNHGCIIADTVVVGDNPPPVATITGFTDALCFGSCDGTATVLATGGAGGYTYQWNTVPQQYTATATGLCAGVYEVYIRDMVNCWDTATVTINEPTAIVLATATTPVTCYGGFDGTASVVAAGGTPPYTYFWSTIPTQITPIASGVSAGVITVTVIDANGCVAIASDTVRSPSDVVTTVTTTEPLCFGGSDGTASATVVGGIPPYSYLWLPGGQVVPNPNNLGAGVHTLVVTDGNGCTDTTLVPIGQPTPIELTYVATPTRCYVPGDNGTATVQPTGGTPPYTYSWNTNPVQVTQIATGLAAGNYTCTVTDNHGCTETIVATVPEILPPNVDIAGTGIFCAGDGGDTLYAQASGGTLPYYYTWWCNSPICGIDSINDNDPVVNPTVTSWYFVQVTDGNGCTSEIDSFEVIVLPKPIVDAGPDDTICGDAAPCVLLQASVSNAPGPYTYQWYPATGLSNPNILTPCARPDTTTIYTLIVTSSNGCTSLAPTIDSLASVTINVPPIPVAHAGPDIDLCLGDTVMLNGFATNAGPHYDFEWSPATGLSDDDIPNPMASPPISTDYILTVYSNGCPSYGDTMALTVHAIPTVAADIVPDICQGDTIRMFAEAWGAPDATEYNYQWWPSTGIIGPDTVKMPYASPDQTTTYYVTVTTEWGCESPYDSTILTIKPTPLADAGPDTFVCFGEMAQLDGGYYYTTLDTVSDTTLIYFSWTPTDGLINPGSWDPNVSPVLSTLYTLTVNYNTCSTSDEVLVHVFPDIDGGAEIDTTIMCQGDSVQLNAWGGLGNAQYNWIPSTGLSDPTIANPWASPDVNTSYTLIVSEGHCADTFTVNLDVLPSPEASFISSLTEGCGEFTVNFLENGVGGVAWIWDFGDGSPVSNDPSTVHTYTQPGTYLVTLTAVTPGGCESKAKAETITVHDMPMAEFTANPNFPVEMTLPGAIVQFTNQSSSNSVQWLWDFGDGSTSSSQHPGHDYQQPGTYEVTLTAINAAGCVDEVVHGPFVVNVPGLLIPNVFSPNGDGLHDRYRVNYSGSQPFTLKIFDRWGNQMYESTDKEHGWDGRNPNMGNAEMAEGVYYYIVTIGGKPYSGNLTLMR